MHVLVRAPGPAFRHALSEHPQRDAIDPERAIAQHAAFVAELVAAGLAVTELPTQPDLADATFVSDTLVALPPASAADPETAVVVVARPASATRRPEVASVLAAARICLRRTVPEVVVEAPDTLEGGDVIFAGTTLFIGISRRTTEGGARTLARAAEALGYRTFFCPVEGRLHLATAVTAVGKRLLIGTAAGFASLEAARPAPGPFSARLDLRGEFERIVLPDREVNGANVLSVEGHCFLGAGNHTAAAALRAKGLTIHEPDLDEFALADGGPTCLVNLVP